MLPTKDVEIKIRGNHMTQHYYATKILPQYIEELKSMRTKYGNAILQEDNDPSHGTRSTWNIPWCIKRSNQLLDTLLVHPAQSPDLNPKEGIWNILKQRVRHHIWGREQELIDLMQREWWQISQQEIQKRIDEMPKRCRNLIDDGGKVIKTELW